MDHVTRRLVVALGMSQLLCWGISYYLVGVFGGMMAADLGQSLTAIHGGFTVALIVQGLTSSRIGQLIDQRGGRPVMVAGSLVMAASLLGLAAARELIGYYAAWVGLGLAMRLTLYDAAFAALARIGGRDARRPIAQVTLLGGLASSVLWPVGQALADAFGWRGALCVYAGIALLTIPLHLGIPTHRHTPAPAPEPAAGTTETPGHAPTDPAPLAAILYALIVALNGLLNSGLSAHMIGLMAGLGLAPALAVWVSTLRGVGQSAARLGEVLFGGRLSPFTLAVLASGLVAFCFLLPLLGMSIPLGVAFALLFGAGNGLLTIVRGTLPLALFDPASYGRTVGRLVTPGFFIAALAPMLYAFVIERFGEAAALWLSLACAIPVVGASLLLKARFGR